MEEKLALVAKLYDELNGEIENGKVALCVNLYPDNIEVRIEPWKPFEYACPYGGGKE